MNSDRIDGGEKGFPQPFQSILLGRRARLDLRIPKKKFHIDYWRNEEHETGRSWTTERGQEHVV